MAERNPLVKFNIPCDKINKDFGASPEENLVAFLERVGQLFLLLFVHLDNFLENELTKVDSN